MIVTRGLGRPAEGNLAVAGFGLRDAGGGEEVAGTAVGSDFFRLTPNDQADLATLDDDELAVALALLLA